MNLSEFKVIAVNADAISRLDSRELTTAYRCRSVISNDK